MPGKEHYSKMKLFGTSGIRGRYPKKINEELAKKIAYAINSYTDGKIAIATDTRTSGPNLKNALIENLNNDIIDFGIVPTPVLCFGVKNSEAKVGIMITASHNPSEDNGFKFWDENGMAFTEDKEGIIENLIAKCVSQKTRERNIENIDILPEYKNAVKEKIKLKGNLKVLIDCGGGAAYRLTPELLEEYGYEVIKVDCKADGSFTNRNPEPNKENLKKTAELVKEHNCDIGFAHDGDADRVMAIDNEGKVVDFDKFLAFICRNFKGKVIATVDTSMTVDNEIKKELIRTKVGDVSVAREIKKQNASFGGEPSGSYIFPEFGLWPDGVYAVFRILSFIEKENRPLSEILSEIKQYHFSRDKIECENKEKTMENLKQFIPKEAELSSIDGLFMKFKDSSVLIRPSGTQQIIRLNIEAETKERFLSLKEHWLKILKEVVENG